MQLRLAPEYANFLFKHEYADMGNYLYFLYVFYLLINSKSRFKFSGFVQNSVSLFFLFLLLSGLYDITHGVQIGDVIRYWRHWLLLSFVYIYPAINRKAVWDSFKITFYICALLCGIILIQRFTSIEIIHIIAISEDRGVKAPSFAIIFGSMLLCANIYKQTAWKRLLFFVIFVLPIVLNLKMTYAVSIFLTFVVYLLITKSMRLYKKVAIGVVSIVGVVIFFSAFSDFSNRFTDVVNERSAIAQEENDGNFSFRILHSQERLNYILYKGGITAMRGIGFVSESHFNKSIFLTGLPDDYGNVIQLDTGDIAWSVFFVRLGLLGLVFYLIMYLSITSRFYKYRSISQMNAFLFSMMLVFLVFSSFGNAIITESSFFIFPLLFLIGLKGKTNNI